jgi:thioredoxin 1
MSKVTPVTSSAHFRTITSSAAFTVVDFYADWCGPCKVISPIFEQLATAESKPGKIVFCKVDVDAQREIAGNYGVSAYGIPSSHPRHPLTKRIYTS